jgi:dUTP pyrophosphatase
MAHMITRPVLDYLAGIYAKIGCFEEGLLVMKPRTREAIKLMDLVMERFEIFKRDNETMTYTCFNEEVISYISTNLVKDECVFNIENNKSFYRAIVDLSEWNGVLLCIELPEKFRGMLDRYYKGIALRELLGSLYDDVYAMLCLEQFAQTPDDYRRVNALHKSIPFYVTDTMDKYMDHLIPGCLRFVKADPDAVIPTRAHPSDAGFDLTLIRKVEVKKPGIVMYDTGIIVIPPYNVFTTIHLRSSAYKYGISLANGTGIIDSSYRGTLKVLIKHDNPDEELKLPVVVTQLVPLPSLHMTAIHVDTIDTTTRGAGGFGSTTKKENEQKKAENEEPKKKESEELQKAESEEQSNTNEEPQKTDDELIKEFWESTPTP